MIRVILIVSDEPVEKEYERRKFGIKLWTTVVLVAIFMGWLSYALILPTIDYFSKQVHETTGFMERIEGYLKRDEQRELERLR